MSASPPGNRTRPISSPRLREIAKNRGFEIYREYSDETSAKDANRPGWKELMEDASNHKFVRFSSLNSTGL